MVGKDASFKSFIFRYTDFEHQKDNLELGVWAEDMDLEKNLCEGLRMTKENGSGSDKNLRTEGVSTQDLDELLRNCNSCCSYRSSSSSLGCGQGLKRIVLDFGN